MNLSNIIKNKKVEEVQENTITIQLTKMRNKYITSIENISYLSQDPNFLKNTSVCLKKQLCCGSSIKNNNIELQGDHIESVRKYLINEFKIDNKSIIIKGK
jgi:translation initiation factor 1 (eIF-1/SUI1)